MCGNFGGKGGGGGRRGGRREEIGELEIDGGFDYARVTIAESMF